MMGNYRTWREKRLNTQKSSADWVNWNLRYIRTYRSIIKKRFKSKILDLGCGQDYFSKTCRLKGYQAEGIDIDKVDFEKDKLPFKDESFNIVHFNAVLEHIKNPESILKEIHRILRPRGIVIINTPNWQLDFKNFYNDPTHAKPYTPIGLKTVVEMYGFKPIFTEPALICKPKFYWRLPFKWRICAWIWGGSKSILLIAEK